MTQKVSARTDRRLEATADRLPETADVVVVGAGPVGLTLATGLAQQGIDVVLVDKAASATTTSRAAVVHARTLEVLRDLGIDLAGEGIQARHLRVRDHDRVLLDVDMGRVPSDFRYALLLGQDATERILQGALLDAGGRVWREREITGTEPDDDGVTVTVGTGETVRAAYVAGTDGMHSFVRERSGIGFTGATYPESFVLADVRLTGEAPRDEMWLYLAPQGVTVLAPLPGGRHRVVATVDEAPETPSADDVQNLLDERGPRRRRLRVADLAWSSRFRVHHRMADHYRAGRLLLAGDAAHVHSPAGGQGMNTGIQDAVRLSEALVSALQGGGESALDAYERDRRPVAEQVVAFTDRMTRMATVRGSVGRRVRNEVVHSLGLIPPVRRALALRVSELQN